MFDVWEIIAPTVERDLSNIDKEKLDPQLDVSQMEDLGVDGEERSYRKEVRNLEVTLDDLKIILMAILRLNDGSTFVETEKAPLP